MTLFKDDSGNEVQFQYVWRFVSYDAKSPKFRIALHVTPANIEYEYKTYKEFPELVNLVHGIVENCHGVVIKSNSVIIGFGFDKEHNDVLERIEKVNSILQNAGVASSKYVDMFSGFPSITYGEAYLHYTTGRNDLSIADILEAISGNLNLREQFGTMPINSSQEFDPGKDTDIEYLGDLLEQEISKLSKKVLDLRPLIKNAIQEALVQNSLDNIPSTEDSDSWNNFQGCW